MSKLNFSHPRLTIHLQNRVDIVEIVVSHVSAHCFDVDCENAIQWLIFLWYVDLCAVGSWFYFTSIQ